MEVQPPIEMDGFFVFDEAIPEKINTLGCDSSITGTCPPAKDVRECLEYCKNTDFCSMGYFIDTSDRKLCVPIKNNLPNTTVYYNRIKHKSIYPELNTVKTNVFVKSLGSTFPPNRANIVFYADSLSLQNVESKLFLTDIKNVELGESPLQMDIIPYRFDIGKNERNYIPVQNYDNVMFNIRGTSLLLTISSDNKLLWEKGNVNDFDIRRTFHLSRLDTDKKNEPFYYGAKFYISYYDKILRVEDKKLTLVEDKQKDKYDVFTFVPNIDVYYKTVVNDKEVCTKISLKNTDVNGIESKYKNNITYRNKTCWILKNREGNKKYFVNRKRSYWLLILVMVCLIFYLKTYTFE